ncbi:MAG: hypothetical protein ACR2H2_00360 [Solirubrobacteraceae bacterium]
MKHRLLLHLGILAAGIVLAASIYAGGGDESPAAPPARPGPEQIGAPVAAPRIAQPGLVSLPALPARPSRPKRTAARRSSRTPSAARRTRRARPEPKAQLQRSRPKPVPLEPPLLAPPE